MKKLLLNPLAVLLVCLVAFTSCKEDETESIFFRTDGGISTVLKDAEGQAIVDAKVSLYNYSTDNRLDVQFTDENGTVDFGRFEAGEYSVGAEFTHNNEYFSIYEEVHIISGNDTQEEINLENHYGEVLIRIFDNNTGELIAFNPELTIGLVPMDEDFRESTFDDQSLIDLVEYSFDSQASLEQSDLPEANYLVLLYNAENIFSSNEAFIDPFDKEYVSFYVNPTLLRLLSKTSWTVTNVSTDNNVNDAIPVTNIEFLENGEMNVTFDNGEVANANYYLGSNMSFDWYNLSSDSYSVYTSDDYHEINSDGSITFYFNYWDIYNNQGYTYADNVAITIN